MAIRYLRSNEIDFSAWNKCIENAINGSIFAYTWYLEIVSPKWEALVEDDYKSVMPILSTKFFGFKIFTQSKFVYFSGIYSNLLIDKHLTERFLSKLPKELTNININLNKYNRIDESNSIVAGKKNIFELDIIRKYTFLRNQYHPWLEKTLQKIEKNNINIISGIQSNELVNLHLKNSKYSFFSLKESEIKKFRLLTSITLRNNTGEIIGAYSNNVLQAAAVFVSSHNNVHLLFYAQTRNGFKSKLLYSIVDFFIKKHAEKNITISVYPTGRLSKYFDLKMYGAQLTEHFCLYQNCLPWYLKHILKKLGNLKNFI